MIDFAVVGAAHPHVLEITSGLLANGARCFGFYELNQRAVLEFSGRFPEIPAIHEDRILSEPSVRLIVTAAVPVDRSAIAIRALRSGRDVLAAKPGCLTLDQLAQIRQAVNESERTWNVWFSERLNSRSTIAAIEMVRTGAIGQPVSVVGLGPHRLANSIRPEWFFDRNRAGGILTDLATHQIDQFLSLAASTAVSIPWARVRNTGHREHAFFDDIGELVLISDNLHGYFKVDWLTPDGLPSWGDGRTFITGTTGTIEIRKFVDPAGASGSDHLILVDGHQTQRVPVADVPLSFFRELIFDVATGGYTAMPRNHATFVTELAIRAESLAICNSSS